MNRLLLILYLVPALLASIPAAAQNGWQELFNGRDLSGWKANAYPGSWSVVDGLLRAQATKESSHLFFVGDSGGDFAVFKDFELEVEARGERDSNSGIFIHTSLESHGPKQHLSKGYEIQLNSTQKELRKTGSLYAVVDLDKSALDESQWFKVRIIVKGRRIMIRVNDKVVVDYREPPRVVRPQNRAGRLLNPAGGAIALQAHDPKSVFYFKSVRIRPL